MNLIFNQKSEASSALCFDPVGYCICLEQGIEGAWPMEFPQRVTVSAIFRDFKNQPNEQP
jgi:hypothetical protein